MFQIEENVAINETTTKVTALINKLLVQTTPKPLIIANSQYTLFEAATFIILLFIYFILIGIFICMRWCINRFTRSLNGNQAKVCSFYSKIIIFIKILIFLVIFFKKIYFLCSFWFKNKIILLIFHRKKRFFLKTKIDHVHFVRKIL